MSDSILKPLSPLVALIESTSIENFCLWVIAENRRAQTKQKAEVEKQLKPISLKGDW